MVHLIKLCVGVESVEQLAAYIAQRSEKKRLAGQADEQIHTTRMSPRRKTELLEGGSLYWVIKGQIQARQALLDLRDFKDEEGIGRCQIVMASQLILTLHAPRRPFQGWRYLPDIDAPADVESNISLANNGDHSASKDHQLPPHLTVELANLGLL